MYRDHTVAVVVPAYNEEKLIGLGMSFIPVIKTMPEYVDHIVVVDDCSQDRTAEVVRGYEDQLGERLVLLEHETNQGGRYHQYRVMSIGNAKIRRANRLM
jgi:glycosyltransferase involved in cell wall biosynthesis